MMSELCADPLSLVLYFLTAAHGARCAPYMTWIVEQSGVRFLDYLEVLAKTFLLEAPFYFVLLRSLRPLWRILVVLLVANLATHPVVYFVIPWLSEKNGWQYSTMLIIAEVFAPLVEVLIVTRWAKTPLAPTIFWIVIANLISWWVGVLITYG